MAKWQNKLSLYGTDLKTREVRGGGAGGRGGGGACGELHTVHGVICDIFHAIMVSLVLTYMYVG